MAIVQISRITNRKGLQENLPQLAGAELGWSIDQRRLFIGNGTLEEGAPAIGNTEILTEFSDIFQFQSTYTYKGEAAGYIAQTGPTPGTPVTQSLQSWLDQFATVKDFGAVGDGIADDTDAINRALQQLYCQPNQNTQIRRGLFFPAGVYRTTETIFIPPFAYLYGEGKDSSIIFLDVNGEDSTLNSYVARTCDNQGRYGISIQTPGEPQNINIVNMGFQNGDVSTNIFLVEDANDVTFDNVGFYGALTLTNLNSDVTDSSCVRFASTPSLITNNVLFNNCVFSGTTYGLNTATEQGGTDQVVEGVTVSNCLFENLYQGIVIGTEPLVASGATGFRILNNIFNNIYAEGIVIGSVKLNVSANNVFYLVGCGDTISSVPTFGVQTAPQTACIDIQDSNNVSLGDLFERPDIYSTSENPGTAYPRIKLNNTTSIATTNGVQLQLGTQTIQSGLRVTLADNIPTATTAFTVSATSTKAFTVNYSIVRGTTYRTGSIFVATDGASPNLTFSDDYTQNADTGIALTVSQSTNNVNIQYTSTITGTNATMSYSIVYLA